MQSLTYFISFRSLNYKESNKTTKIKSTKTYEIKPNQIKETRISKYLNCTWGTQYDMIIWKYKHFNITWYKEFYI